MRSLFNRAARKVKAFFGWHEQDYEGDQESLAQTVSEQEASELDTKKPKRDGDGDGGESGGDPAALPQRKAQAADTEEEESEHVRDENSRPVNYIKPPDVSDEESERQRAVLRHTLQRRRKAAEHLRSDAEKQRKQIRLAHEQREQRPRVMQAKAQAKACDKLERDSPQKRLEMAMALLPSVEAVAGKDDYEFGS